MTIPSINDWFFRAVLSAVFAALTAIFAKLGLEGVDSDFATLIRTFVIVFVLTLFVYFAGKWSNPFALSQRTLLFLALSALATGASWVCYFRALKVGGLSDGRCRGSGAGVQEVKVRRRADVFALRCVASFSPGKCAGRRQPRV